LRASTFLPSWSKKPLYASRRLFLIAAGPLESVLVAQPFTAHSRAVRGSTPADGGPLTDRPWSYRLGVGDLVSMWRWNLHATMAALSVTALVLGSAWSESTNVPPAVSAAMAARADGSDTLARDGGTPQLSNVGEAPAAAE